MFLPRIENLMFGPAVTAPNLYIHFINWRPSGLAVLLVQWLEQHSSKVSILVRIRKRINKNFINLSGPSFSSSVSCQVGSY